MNSVAIKSIDRDQIRQAVASFAVQIRKQHPEVERVIWFGSWVTGLPTPGSDVAPEHMILFGSQARGDACPHSDIALQMQMFPEGTEVELDLCAECIHVIKDVQT